MFKNLVGWRPGDCFCTALGGIAECLCVVRSRGRAPVLRLWQTRNPYAGLHLFSLLVFYHASDALVVWRTIRSSTPGVIRVPGYSVPVAGTE